jgi:hypothetical protein
MREQIPEHFVAGMKVLMRIGSPVRQWMYTLEARPKAWLTPTRYMAASCNASMPNFGLQYVEVEIAKVMPPYAIVHHHDGQEWVRLWLDMREVQLFEVGK